MKLSLKLLLIVPVLLYACEQEADKILNFRKVNWRMESVSLKITMNSVNNSDSSKVFSVDESNWDKKMKMRPIHTIFRADGTYNSEHFI